MSTSRLYVRSEYREDSKSRKTTLIIGIVCGILAIAFFTAFWLCGRRRAEQQVQHDAEVARAEHRRVNGGWWGREISEETTVERRMRMVRERREGIERSARGGEETGGGEPAPPMYQLPAPTYPSTPEMRRQWLMANRPSPNLPLAPIDAPPAYDSPAVWPTRS